MDFKKILQYTQDLNVLYVEDDKNLLEETSDFLEDYFRTLTTATNGKDALEKYDLYHKQNSSYYDLVITDINMPIMNGNILIDNITQINSEQKIIVVSAYSEADKLINLIEKGISNFLLKPITPTQLINTLYKTCKSIVAQKNMKMYNQALADMNIDLDKKVKQLTSEILAVKRLSIETITDLIESYDDDTGSHVKRIELYTYAILDNLPDEKSNMYPKELKESISFASLLHDTGKFLIPKEILNKPAKLSEEEFEVMKTHAEIGGKILIKANDTFKLKFKKDSYFKIASDIAYYHHEKWNGKGYPKGLQGENIPICARIVAIADVYDALRSKRSYKVSFSHSKSVDIIKNESGKAFDPKLVDIFLKNSEKFNTIFAQNMENDKGINS